ncbi:hypothetical protein B0H16DRAFT_1571438 [Mycena metata]|uniref:MARVEL domain-containing protein n=1 Tax=Mycena metata TaxID=1033252 RepID=A0AAD7I9C5_9AGAR|nr:hypothetical protein B0H16DRAFT_1571438 [Mycena metata]
MIAPPTSVPQPMALPLTLIRVVVLSTAIIFASIEIGLGAALTATGASLSYAILAIATGTMTVLTLPAMIGLGIFRPGGLISMIIVEILWLFTLSILWLATGANSVGGGREFGCGHIIHDAIVIFSCPEISALEGFAFSNGILLLTYVGTLLVLALGAASQKRSAVWTSSVAGWWRDTNTV